MARTFNIAGPCVPERHYMLPALNRLPTVPDLVQQMGYFTVRAPSQSGKTTTIKALVQGLTASGKYAALHFTCKPDEISHDNYAETARVILAQIRSSAEEYLPTELQPPPWPEPADTEILGTGLGAWAEACPLPLVLFFDEIDALQGRSLISVLRQLRAGFNDRPEYFPASIGLCGQQNIHTYQAGSDIDGSPLWTTSFFNITIKSLRLADFSINEIDQLYRQHTQDTGQQFTLEAVRKAWELTAGQPWLVNALAAETIQEIGIPNNIAITAEHMDEAARRLSLARATHFDSLADKLTESRVQRIIQPIISGEIPTNLETYDDDATYVRDLGLIAPDDPIRIANPIYQEIVVRVLSSLTAGITTINPHSFIRPDKSFDFPMMLREFAEFWALHAPAITSGRTYSELTPQLTLMGFLQRVVNGGGIVTREYGVGSGRIDIHIRWPYISAGKRLLQEEAIELKVWRENRPDPLARGLDQLDGYLDRLGIDHGTLIIFDCRQNGIPPSPEPTLEKVASSKGRTITVMRA